jgi:hypothetical protein
MAKLALFRLFYLRSDWAVGLGSGIPPKLGSFRQIQIGFVPSDPGLARSHQLASHENADTTLWNQRLTEGKKLFGIGFVPQKQLISGAEALVRAALPGASLLRRPGGRRAGQGACPTTWNWLRSVYFFVLGLARGSEIQDSPEIGFVFYSYQRSAVSGQLLEGSFFVFCFG